MSVKIIELHIDCLSEKARMLREGYRRPQSPEQMAAAEAAAAKAGLTVEQFMTRLHRREIANLEMQIIKARKALAKAKQSERNR